MTDAIDTIRLDTLHINDGSYGLPKNPRFIRDERFHALCRSIADNPEYMPARPIIVNEAGVILGGNMRYRACLENGLVEVPASWVQRVEGWPVEKQKRFIVLDNRGFGEDDMDALANEWDFDELLAAGFAEVELGKLSSENEDDEEPTEEAREDLKPIRRCHVLISMTSDQALEWLPRIEALLKDASVEVCHAGN